MTQRRASTRFDLPQPFGPTTPVRPGSIAKSVGSTKDLKPIRRSRVSFIAVIMSIIAALRRRRESPKGSRRERMPGAGGCRIGAENESSRTPSATRAGRIIQTFACSGASIAAPTRRPRLEPGRGKKPLSCLEIGVDLFGQLVDREVADHLLAVDEKSRRRVDAELLRGVVAHRLDAVEQLLIRQASLNRLSVKPNCLAISFSGGSGFLTIQSACLANSVSTIGMYLSLPPQRASMKPAAESASSGNSRKMKRTLPVSM